MQIHEYTNFYLHISIICIHSCICILLFWPFRSVFRSSSSSFSDSGRVQYSANNMITNSRQIRNPTATDHHDRMFLQIMPDSGNIRRHFHSVGKPDPGNLSKRRIWFFGSGCGNLDADAALEGTVRADWTIFERIENSLHRRRF